MLTIAEIGSNYRDFDDILNYCYRLNADVIKLQYYTSRDLFGFHHKVDDQVFSGWQLAELKATCEKLNKKLMISIFNHERVKELDPFIDYHKVASSEITYILLLEEIANTGKDVFVSTGGATRDEISQAVSIIGKDRTILMGCNVEYPTNNSWPFDGLYHGKEHGCRWGYSDHSKEVFLVHKVCDSIGAYAWEKHVMFAAINDKPDHTCAITINDFNAAVAGIWTPKINKHKRAYFCDHLRKGWYRPI